MSHPLPLALRSLASVDATEQQARDRARALMMLFGVAALGAGALAAFAPLDVLAFVAILLLILLAAWILPLPWATLLLASLLPFQFYVPFPGSSFTIRIALIFAYAVAGRVVLRQWPSVVVGRQSAEVRRLVWLLPALLFLVAALIAAFWAQDRYAALKGVYDWLAVIVTALVIAASRPARATVRLILMALVAGGVLQALLGLAQSAMGLDVVIGLLRLPVSGLLYQPDLLNDRLNDLSFNWIMADRVLPFGTFINGIDYAVFLAAILSLLIAFLLAPERRPAVGGRRSIVVLAPGAAVIGVALLLTLKGSGALALAGGMAALALIHVRRLSRRVVIAGLCVLGLLVVLAVPFSDLLGQRALFLLQREQGLSGTIGRLSLWSGLVPFIAQRPFFGYGLNNANLLIDPLPTLRAGASALISASPESAYLSSLVETGLVGFAALAVWLFAPLLRAYRRATGNNATIFAGVVATVAALLAGNLTVSGFTTDQDGMLLGILIGIIYGMEPNE